MSNHALILSVLLSLSPADPAVAGQDNADHRLRTRWARDVDADGVHPEHPRPGLKRDAWASLNGQWEYAIRPREEGCPNAWDGQIVVPFAVESILSGVTRRVLPEQRLWYRRSFTVPRDWMSNRILLRFGAVDWRAEVWVDGRRVGAHEGGYDGFSFDITGALAASDEHTIEVAVWDPSDAGFQPRGKQVLEPHGIWYTPVTGIWQTVWLEAVPRTAIDGVDVAVSSSTDGIPDGRVRIDARVPGQIADLRLEAVASLDGREVARADGTGSVVELVLDSPALWSPDRPALYDLTLRLLDGEHTVDVVDSYFALRTVAVRPDDDDVPRIHLNGRPVFQLGLLDQGYWPDGLYTAPTDEALRFDVEVTRRLGFNLARKHVKVEPDRWYYHCDRLGLLVWQDIPSGGPFIGANDPDAERSAHGAANFEREVARIVDGLRHHPCIVSWVLFNEGWGQYDTERLATWLTAYDPTRFVNSASGWTDRGVGAVHDVHAYPGPGMPTLESNRAAVLGEFGGLGLPLAGHTWQSADNWGYRSFTSTNELIEAYVTLVSRLRLLIRDGLSAAVYTQTTDVEIEVNGVMTYDRAIVKLDDPRVIAANRSVHLPPPRLESVIPTSRKHGQVWNFTTEAPLADWTAVDFDDRTWSRGPGGFGTENTPGAVVRTTWSTSDIWMRREVQLADLPDVGSPALLIHHDEDAEVYLNGTRIASLAGYTTSHVIVALADDARTVLVPGSNVLAVHCRQTRGGQFIDVGVVFVTETLHESPQD